MTGYDKLWFQYVRKYPSFATDSNGLSSKGLYAFGLHVYRKALNDALYQAREVLRGEGCDFPDVLKDLFGGRKP